MLTYLIPFYILYLNISFLKFEKKHFFRLINLNDFFISAKPDIKEGLLLNKSMTDYIYLLDKIL